MKKEDKVNVIAQIGDVIKEYAHFYLVDVTAMNAAATNAMRAKCYKQEVKMLVVKNTLLKKAFDAAEVDYYPLFPCLKGTTALLLCNTANVPAKLIKDVAGNQHLSHRMRYFSSLDGETFNAERKVSCDRVAVATVKSCDKYTVTCDLH